MHMMKGGTIEDATLISAPSSTKNSAGSRDPEMHQTKKGNEWHFGMKMHVGVDAGTGYVHTIEATSANEHDITATSKLLRKDDEVVYGDSAYLGIEKRPEIQGDKQKAAIDYRINQRPGKTANIPHRTGKDWNRYIEHKKSAVRCKVEHAFRIAKGIFGYRKVVYRGLSKNLNRFYMLFGSANLLMCTWAGRKPCLHQDTSAHF